MTFLGWLSNPFKGLGDLELGDEKVTLNHLVLNRYLDVYIGFYHKNSLHESRKLLPGLRMASKSSKKNTNLKSQKFAGKTHTAVTFS